MAMLPTGIGALFNKKKKEQGAVTNNSLEYQTLVQQYLATQGDMQAQSGKITQAQRDAIMGVTNTYTTTSTNPYTNQTTDGSIGIDPDPMPWGESATESPLKPKTLDDIIAEEAKKIRM